VAEIRVHAVDEQMTDKDQHMGDIQMMDMAQEGHVRSENEVHEMSDKLKIKWKKVKEFMNYMSPKGLGQLIQNLNDKQREDIQEIDFVGVLHLQTDIIPNKMAVWLVQNLDTCSCFLPLANGRMRVAEHDVHVMLGLPMGPLEIVQPDNEIIRLLSSEAS